MKFSPKGGLPQPRKPLTPTLWVAFALSGIVILMGAMIPYASCALPLTRFKQCLEKVVQSGPTTNPAPMSHPQQRQDNRSHLAASYTDPSYQ